MREKRDIGRGREWGKKEREKEREGRGRRERERGEREGERRTQRERGGGRGCDVMCVWVSGCVVVWMLRTFMHA